MSSSNLVRIAAVAEVTPGTTPGTAFSTVRKVSDSLSGTPVTAESAEARADREHAVAIAKRVLYRRYRGAPQAETRVQRVIGWKGAETLQRGADRSAQKLGQLHELATGIDGTPADEQARRAR